jgi:hypothetical protein
VSAVLKGEKANVDIGQLIESGIFGSWYYEKWVMPDGRKVFEAYAPEPVNVTIPSWTAIGQLYYNEGLPYPALPSGMVIQVADVKSTSGASRWASVANASYFGIVSVYSTAPVTMGLLFRVKGTWT